MAEAPHDLRRTTEPPSKTEPRTGVVVRIDIPPSNHPAVIKGDGPGAQSGRQALQGLYEAWGRIQDTAGQVQDKGRLAAAAQPFAERALDSASRALATLAQQREHLERQIAAAVAPKQSDPYAGEIRGHWRSRAAGTGKARAPVLEALRKTIEGGDLQTASAVLSAPAYLSGLSEEQQGILRTAAARAAAPELVQQHEETQEAMGRLNHAVDDFSATMVRNLRTWKDEDNKHLEALR